MKVNKSHQNKMFKEQKGIIQRIMCPFADGSQINKFAPKIVQLK